MRVLDLFSGIGGFSLGLERAGMKTVAFCEIDPFCRRVLAKHWPGVPIYDDVRDLSAERLASDGVVVDLICGGFPCQDISLAGSGAGLAGARSGLWREYARLIGELRPRFVIVENVAALLGRGMGDVLGDLAALGFDAEWHCIPASAVGAPHRRDRIWIVAYPNEGGRREQGDEREAIDRAWAGQPEFGGDDVADAASVRRELGESRSRGAARVETWGEGFQRLGGQMAFTRSQRLEIGPGTLGEWAHAATSRGGIWDVETRVGGEIDGVPTGMDGVAVWERGTARTVAQGYPDRRQRLMALGNAVVPQVVEMIGRAIKERDV